MSTIATSAQADRAIYRGRNVDQVVADGRNTYVLEGRGVITKVDRRGRTDVIGNARGTDKIAADNGSVYRLRHGDVEEYTGGWSNSWRKLDGGGGIRDIAASGIRCFAMNRENVVVRLYLRGRYEIWDNTGYSTRMSSDENGSLWLAVENSRRDNFGIYKVRGPGQYEKWDSHSNRTTSFVGAGNGQLFLLRDTGNVFLTYNSAEDGRWSGERTYERGDAREIAATSARCYGTIRGSEAVEFDRGRAVPIFRGTRDRVRQVSARNGGVVASTSRGDVYKVGGGSAWDGAQDEQKQKFEQLHEANEG